MADQGLLKILRQGADVWNHWRENDDDHVHLDGVDFSGAALNGVNLSNAGLYGANFNSADLEGADLSKASLSKSSLGMANLKCANLTGASLSQAHLKETNLECANLSNAYVQGAEFIGTCLDDADLSEVTFGSIEPSLSELNYGEFDLYQFTQTLLLGVDLTKTIGLDSCMHFGPSYVDHDTLRLSKNVPISFWRGCGLPDRLIEYMPSIFEDAIQFYSCFISYSSQDQEFAERLHADLQNKGVRCWFAPHDLPIGEKILDGLDEAIRMRDKLVLILSEKAIASDWVEDEVGTAFEEERRRKETVLFPIRLDEAVMETNEAWASKLRARNIGDFTRWKNHDVYKAMFDRMLQDLKVER